MAKISDSNVLYNKAPAGFIGNRWLDASVTGNGKVGAAVLGAYSNESILINHTNLKWRGYTGVLQDVSDVFPRVRKFYGEAKIFEAEKILSNELTKRNYKPEVDSPLPLAVINLNFINEGFITDYQRTTDMKSGEVCVAFRAGSTQITRSLFVARGSDIIAYNVTKGGSDKINVVLGLQMPDGVTTQNSVFKYEGGIMYFSARNSNGLDYGIVARVIAATGTAEHLANGISVKGCDGLTVFAKTFVNSSRDTEFKNLKNELTAIKLSYDKMQAQSEAVHKKLFFEAELELAQPTNNHEMGGLVALTGTASLDANLIERLFNFGKFLAITGGGMMIPAGLWCGNSKVSNGYLSVNNTAHLLYDGITKSVTADSILELFEYYEKYVDDLKKNAARVYGARGYFVPGVVSPQSALFGSTDARVLHFVASSALMANLFYSHYLVTGDTKILKGRIFPFMREVFNFYSDFLKLDSSGYYSTIPSYSCDSTPGNTIQGKPLVDFKFTTNSTIDFLALANLLDNLIEGAAIVGAQSEIVMWQDMKTKIPPFSVNEGACLREYTNSAFIDGTYNCGCLHNYGLYPLKNFSFSDEAVQYRAAVSGVVPPSITLKKASANAIITRLNKASGLQTASVLAMYAVQLAHAGEAAAVKNLLLRLVAACFTQSGLCLTNDWRGSGWTKAGAVDLDISGNLGFATAITECIVQSNSGALKVLPATFAEISSGQIKNIATDFAARVNLDWDLRRGRCSIKIMPKVNCKIDVIMPKDFKRIKTKEINFNSETGMIKDLQLVAGKAVTLDF